MFNKPLDLIGARLGWGARLHETQFGPQALKDFGLPLLLKKYPLLQWQPFLSPRTEFQADQKLSYHQRLQEVHFFAHLLSERIQTCVKNGHFPIVLGGDHAIAMGTWQGMLKAHASLGLIWIDAHLDAHTPATTPSQAIHGMPLAVLLGYGESLLVKEKFAPHQIVLIGVRSFEPLEAEFLKRLKVKVYFMEQVKQWGFKKVFLQALAQVTYQTDGFGISIDLDAFDPTIAPGVGTPEKDGLKWQEVKEGLRGISAHPQLKALEIAEYNPVRDIDNQTALLIQNILLSI